MSQDAPEAASPAAQHEGLAAEPIELQGIHEKPFFSRMGVYLRLSGPGWLQSAITLGGGSLGSSLFLGVLLGFAGLWIQPLAMILGVVMLSAIGYVALTTGKRPFQAINEHINPVLGWGWALATAMANVVWCLPQFGLGTASLQQNLFPSLVGPKSGLPDTVGKVIAAGAILLVCLVVIWFYDKGSKGIRIFEGLLKIMVGIIILCFFGVVVKLSFAGLLDWGAIGGGLIPDLSILTKPAATFAGALAATGKFADYWSGQIVYMQRDVMISAAATAVGINMTFLLPYSMLAKGWRRNARGLAIFDLSTGLFVPFILATGCVVLCAASQFHVKHHPGLLDEPYKMRAKDGTTQIVNVPEGQQVDEATLRELQPPSDGLVRAYKGIADARVRHAIGDEAYGKLTSEQKATARAALPQGDRRIAAMLIKRSNFDLAAALQPLTGDIFSQYVFGIGVVGMAVSSIIILMLISGFVICEMLGVKPEGNAHRLACLVPVLGVLGPFIWHKAAAWLVVPTSVFGMVLAPIAYWTFFCMMNSKSLLGEHMPKGMSRVTWNVLMLVAAGVITFGSVYSIWSKARYYGLAGLGAFLLLLIVVQIRRGGVKLDEIRTEPEDA